MIKQFIQRHELKISRIAIVIIFLALIRTIAEFFRLEYILGDALTTQQVKPFIIGALAASISCLLMTILSFYLKHKIIIIVSVLTIIALVLIKNIYLL